MANNLRIRCSSNILGNSNRKILLILNIFFFSCEANAREKDDDLALKILSKIDKSNHPLRSQYY
jgi:hypothetical protein